MIYYGFDNIDSISITVDVPLRDFHAQSKSIEDTYNQKIAEMEKIVKAQLDAAEEQVKDMRKEIAVMQYARDCFLEVLQLKSFNFFIHLNICIDLNSPEDRALVEKHLNMVGLSGRYSRNSRIELDYYTPT